MTPPFLHDLAERWVPQAARTPSAQSYLIELCHARGVKPQRPAGSGYKHLVKVISHKGEELKPRLAAAVDSFQSLGPPRCGAHKSVTARLGMLPLLTAVGGKSLWHEEETTYGTRLGGGLQYVGGCCQRDRRAEVRTR